MNLIQPKLPAQLEAAGDLVSKIAEARERETDLTQLQVSGVSLMEAELSKLGFSKVVFQNCRLAGCSFFRTEFTDVRFEDCDLSGCRFGEGYFSRCEFESCKGVGMALQNALLQNVSIRASNLGLSNFTGATLKGVFIAQTDLSGASIAECKLSKLELEEDKLIGVSFFKTPLSGVDFTTCQLESITASGEELRGAIVTAYQAAQLAKLWGLIVR